ncbi:hypothetical protein FB451DRAFT_1165852 [Mycena latifolia]|nr:hypothetical protein FB451DRAFT_1165852 [Mycena latifolia]
MPEVTIQGNNHAKGGAWGRSIWWGVEGGRKKAPLWVKQLRECGLGATILLVAREADLEPREKGGMLVRRQRARRAKKHKNNNPTAASVPGKVGSGTIEKLLVILVNQRRRLQPADRQFPNSGVQIFPYEPYGILVWVRRRGSSTLGAVVTGRYPHTPGRKYGGDASGQRATRGCL